MRRVDDPPSAVNPTPDMRKGETIGQVAESEFDFGAMRDAIESGDAGRLADLYAEDAVVRIVNRDSQPGSPFVLRGRGAISEHLRTVFRKGVTHRVENEVVGRRRAAFNQVCAYPDGTRVLTATIVEFGGGEVSSEVSVEVWDEKHATDDRRLPPNNLQTTER